MIAEKIKKIFDPYERLDIEVCQKFSELGEIVEFPTGIILKSCNTSEKYFNILLEGTGGILLWHKNNYVCLAFSEDVLMDYSSFILQLPTPTEVVTFEKSTLFRISHQNFQKVFEPKAFGEKISRKALEAAYIFKQNQQIDLLTKTAKQRYLGLVSNNKSVNRIPLKYVASYLGITPQSLSRIRAEKIK